MDIYIYIYINIYIYIYVYGYNMDTHYSTPSHIIDSCGIAMHRVASRCSLRGLVGVSLRAIAFQCAGAPKDIEPLSI